MKKILIVLVALIASYSIRLSLMSGPIAYCNKNNERSLYAMIRRYKSVVVLITHQPHSRHRRHQKIQRSDVQKAFESLARSGYYPKRAVLFLHINAATPIGKRFIQDYALDTSDVPMLILLSDGVVVHDQHGMVHSSGRVTRCDVKKWIDSYLNVDIAQYVQEERSWKEYRSIIRDRAHVYYSPYFSKVANPWNGYWGWPYYGMAQGHYGGNVGVVSTGSGLGFFGANY